ncbi:hypothetical protein BLA29_005519 [Euroglyphus maynei]|uniref:BTB domain-containing protein n=1 Tax=Euroglyphus maynei TaxID=6958 RepID=A0A1Y3AU59_EURMA|nr:hypothetical protein BLA29_005519 [Euroglyphus maynei]
MELKLLNGMDFRLEEGGTHMVALNSLGQLFAWGSNNFGQIGIGTITECEHINYVMDNIVEMSCGYSHTIALTNDGQVYFWGSISKDLVHANPFRFTRLDHIKIIAIASHRHESLIRSCDDEFFIIGKIDDNVYDLIKLDIRLSDSSKIKQIFGVNHNFFSLSDDGIIHKWQRISNKSKISLETLGKTRKKFLYNGGGNGFREPEENVSKINEIIVVKNYEKYDEFITILDDGYCKWRNISIWLTSISDTIGMTILSPFVISPSYLISLNNFNDCSIEKNDDENNNGDGDSSFIRLKINDRILYIHRSYLMERSEYFRRMFIEYGRTIKNGDTIIINDNDYPFPVYYYYLRYLYTDTLIVERDLIGKLFELAVENDEYDLKARLAHHYHDDEHNFTFLNFFTHSR